MEASLVGADQHLLAESLGAVTAVAAKLNEMLADTGAVIRIATQSPSGELSDESSSRRALSSDEIATDTK